MLVPSKTYGLGLFDDFFDTPFSGRRDFSNTLMKTDVQEKDGNYILDMDPVSYTHLDVYKRQDLLRQSASDVGNDHRLGANEAPPAIISIFLGEQLEDVVKQLVETGEAKNCLEGGKLQTGVRTLPDLNKDATDRNRTSPFAFTGNKFEFRMVGSADSIASPNTTLNAIVAEAFCEAADELEKAEDFDVAVHDLIKKYLTEHQRIIFNGNGYSCLLYTSKRCEGTGAGHAGAGLFHRHGHAAFR